MAQRVLLADSIEFIINRQYFKSYGFKGCDVYGTYQLILESKDNTPPLAFYDDGEDVWHILKCYRTSPSVIRKFNQRVKFIKKVFDDMNIDYVE